MTKEGGNRLRPGQLIYRWLRLGTPASGPIYALGLLVYHLLRRRRLYITSRILEVPFILGKMKAYDRRQPLNILELGDVVSERLSRDGHRVFLVDLEPETPPSPTLTVFKDDIRNVSLPQSYFDLAVSISTLEHIGLWGLEFDDGDLMAVDKIYHSLRGGGLLYCTFPFGRERVFPQNLRVYDGKRLARLLEPFSSYQASFYAWKGFRWGKVSLEEAGRVDLGNPLYIKNVALVSAQK